MLARRRPRRAMFFAVGWCYAFPLDDIWEDAMSRTFVVAALAAACLVGFADCSPVQAEPAVKSSKSNTSEKTKGQPVLTTADKGTVPSTGGRTDSEYGGSDPKSR
jgi:1,2-phenylacetyl-CoA epoxidase catalytic subunit